MPISPEPYGRKVFAEIKGKRMAYVDVGEGDAVVFQHGNPTSSYLWRNVMPHCEGLGRLIACDLIGMGDSEKLDDSGPSRYTYAEQRDYLFALWDRIAIGRRVVFVSWYEQIGTRIVGQWLVTERDGASIEGAPGSSPTHARRSGRGRRNWARGRSVNGK